MPTDGLLRPIQSMLDLKRALSGQQSELSSHFRAILGLQRTFLAPKMSLSDRKRVLSSRQRSTKRGFLRPIEGALKPAKDALRPTQNLLNSNRALRIDKWSSQASTEPS